MLVAGIGSWIVAHVLNSIAGAIGDAINAGISWLVQSLTSITALHFGTRYVALYEVGLWIAGLCATGVLLVAAGVAAVKGSLKPIGDAVARVFVGIVASFALLTIVLMLQNVVHGLDLALLSTLSHSNQQVGAAVSAALAAVFGTGIVLGFSGPFLFILIGLVVLLGIVTLFAVLALTSAIAYLACFFAPIAFVFSAKSARKVLEIIFAMIVTPFVITAIIAVGVSVLATSRTTAAAPVVALGHFLIGGGIVWLGVFAPFLVLKMLPIAESSIAQLHQTHQSVGRAVQGGGSVGRMATGKLRQAQQPAKTPSGNGGAPRTSSGTTTSEAMSQAASTAHRQDGTGATPTPPPRRGAGGGAPPPRNDPPPPRRSGNSPNDPPQP